MPVTRHVLYADFDDAWEALLRPWFEQRVKTAWEAPLPTVVSCPNGGLVSLLKQRLLEENIPALGIHFTTPGSLRRLLTPLLEAPVRLALREDLHLLARIVAREAGGEEPVAQSVAADPSAFVRALDTLEAGGWGPEQLPLSEAAALGRSLRSLLEQCGLQTVRRVDWRLDEAAAKASPRLGAWLAVGFSSADWPEFALLRAACQNAAEASLCFRVEGEAPVAAAWAGAWEALAGPVEEYLAAPDPAELPMDSLAERFATHTEGGSARARFIVTRHQATEAEIVLREVQAALKENPGGRVGVVVPARPAGIGREVARVFADADLPHQDRLGHRPAKAPPHRLFTTWVAYQSARSLASLLAFAKNLHEVNQWPVARLRDLERTGEHLFSELMCQDLGPLAACRTGDANSPSAIAEFLATWPLLPQVASLEELASVAEPQLEALEWPEDRPALFERLAGLKTGLAELPIQGSSFLSWLAAVADIPGRTRERTAREPFAPVQLLTLSEAAGQSWDTLIFTGMTHEDWPGQSPESPFLPDGDIARLNARAFRGGEQGIGHQSVAKGCALMPNRGELARQAAEDFTGLLGSVRQGLTASVSLGDPATPALLRPVSEWFLRLCSADRGVWPEPRVLLHWAESTEQAMRNNLMSKRKPYSEVADAQAVRCDRSRPFDAFSYGLESPPQNGLNLSASAWSRVFERPVQVWYTHILRAEPPFDPAHENPSRQARGTWAHAWLSLESAKDDGWLTLPAVEDWWQSVRAKAGVTRERVEAAFAAAGRTLPEWWQADWAKARALALGFAEAVTESGLGHYVTTESAIDAGTYHLNTWVPALSLRGRMDLVLADRVPDFKDETAPIPGSLVVIDFKTGQDKPLTDSRLKKGEGLQIALYALALRNLAGCETQAVLLTPGAVCSPQMSTETMDALEPLWRTVAEVASTGILGDLPEPGSGFGFSAPRPLAELGVPDEVLRARWALTHPSLDEEAAP